MWVSPFRYLRIKVYLQLPVAFRSLSRLSSALSAKASTLRSYSLNHIYFYIRVFRQSSVTDFFNKIFGFSRMSFLSFSLQKIIFKIFDSLFGFQGTIREALSFTH